jgi:hypothetical protein
VASRSRGKRSKAKYSLQKLINHVRDFDESWQIINSWAAQEGDDRSQAIVASALLEQALEYGLSSNFVLSATETHALFADQDDGGVSSFASKIKLAFALGIIEKLVRSELVAIKNIRNVFAHTRASVTFATPDIIGACNDLKIPELILYDNPLTGSSSVVGEKPTTAKGRFSESIRWLYLYFATIESYETVKSSYTYEYSDYYCNTFLKRKSSLQLGKELVALSEASSPTLPEK